jgi:hypothetical protein
LRPPFIIGGSANTHALSVTAGPWGDVADDAVTLVRLKL